MESKCQVDMNSKMCRLDRCQRSLIAQLIQQQKEYKESLQCKEPNIAQDSNISPTNSMIRTQLNMLHHEISKLDQRMQNIQLVKGDKCPSYNLRDMTSSSDSDAEHIYETIAEVDSDLEPIYTSPYEPLEEPLVTKTTKQQSSLNFNPTHRNKESNSKTSSGQSKTSKSNSSTEEPENSFYDVRGSSTSNFETPSAIDINQQEAHRSTVILCSSSLAGHRGDNKKAILSNCDKCQTGVNAKPKKNKACTSKVISSSSAAAWPSIAASHMLSDTVYTNAANLEQTMLLQQEIFRHSLVHRNKFSNCTSKPTTSFGAAVVPELQFCNSRTVHKTNSKNQVAEINTEWKVKCRSDGTRYVTRRSERTQSLKNKARRISEERVAISAGDGIVSLKLGKLWMKQEHKKQLEQTKGRKFSKELINSNLMVDAHQTTLMKVVYKNNGTKKKLDNSDGFIKKYRNKISAREGFRNCGVQVEPQASKSIPSPSSKTGLLSVTTV